MHKACACCTCTCTCASGARHDKTLLSPSQIWDGGSDIYPTHLAHPPTPAQGGWRPLRAGLRPGWAWLTVGLAHSSVSKRRARRSGAPAVQPRSHQVFTKCKQNPCRPKPLVATEASHRRHPRRASVATGRDVPRHAPSRHLRCRDRQPSQKRAPTDHRRAAGAEKGWRGPTHPTSSSRQTS